MSVERKPFPTTVAVVAATETSVDEKSEISNQSHNSDWSEAEERAIVRKLDFLLMPLLIAGFFVLQLDRGNIGNALTDFFLKEVGITQFQFNVGNQLLSLGIVLLELPSNLILYRVGPQKWISCQIICWGLVATFQAFQRGKGVGVYYATRLLLGLLEAGFIPAGLYTLTQWYKRQETSRRFVAFFLGNMLASAASGLIAYGILQMRGVAGLSGWQWMFLIEGMLTIVVGIIFGLFMPYSPENSSTILGYSYFTPREVYILTQRVAGDSVASDTKPKYVRWADIRAAFSRWYMYPQLTVSFCAIAVISPLGTYQPSMIASYGYDRLQANALASVGNWIVIVLSLAFGWIADKTSRRGGLILFASVLSFAFCLATRQLATSTNRDLKYGVLICCALWGSIIHPLNGSWLAVNIPNPAERSISMAVLIMTVNTAGLAGAQIFQAQDAPLYRTGFTVILSLIAKTITSGSYAKEAIWSEAGGSLCPKRKVSTLYINRLFVLPWLLVLVNVVSRSQELFFAVATLSEVPVKMRLPTRFICFNSLLYLGAVATQVANFEISHETAEAHECGELCQKRLGLTIPADVKAVGRDFDVDFYTTAGNFSRASSKPGDVLKLEAIDPKTLSIDGGASAYRFQYVSLDADGSIVPVTGFIAFPFTPHISPFHDGEAPTRYRLAAFAHGTIGIFRGCAPSNSPMLYDYGTWQPALQRGYAIVATDYAGLGNNETTHKYLYFPAHASDLYYSVVAARKLFGDRLTDEWVSFGHSQGGGAAWKLAESIYVRSDASYLGTVAVAPATYAASQLFDSETDTTAGGGNSSSGSTTPGVGFLPLLPTAVQRVIPSYSESILAPTLRKRVSMVEHAQLCLEGVLGLTLDLNISQIASVEGALRDRPTLMKWQNMSAPAQGDVSPAPILVIQGQRDSAVRWKTTVDAWERACTAGNEVHLRLLPTQGHRPSLSAGAPEWLAWLDQQFEKAAANAKAGACKVPLQNKCTKFTREPFNDGFVRAPTDVDLKPYLGPMLNFM
ncbi:hypothetical protein PWT90_01757 [Aphanocladium album]|nr:hypothetical protein PWT90_01757 [Aphanocladium album]